MAHKLWAAWASAYADGSLRWPVSVLVAWHSKHCPECRSTVRSELALLRQVDEVLFAPAEIAFTAAALTRKAATAGARREVRWFVPALAGVAAAALLSVGGWQLREYRPGAPGGDAVYASSSYGDFVVEFVRDEHLEELGGSGAILYTSDSQGAG